MQPFFNSIVYRSKEGIIRERKATLMKFRKKIISFITALTILLSGSGSVMAAGSTDKTIVDPDQLEWTYTIYSDPSCTEVVDTGVFYNPKTRKTFGPFSLASGHHVKITPSGEDGFFILGGTKVQIQWKLNRAIKHTAYMQGAGRSQIAYSFGPSTIQSYGTTFTVNEMDAYYFVLTNWSSEDVTLNSFDISYGVNP